MEEHLLERPPGTPILFFSKTRKLIRRNIEIGDKVTLKSTAFDILVEVEQMAADRLKGRVISDTHQIASLFVDADEIEFSKSNVFKCER